MLFPFNKKYAVIHNTRLIDFDEFTTAIRYYDDLDPRAEWISRFKATSGACCDPCRVVFVQYVDLPGYDDLLHPLESKEFTLEDYESEREAR